MTPEKRLRGGSWFVLDKSKERKNRAGEKG